MEKKHNKSLSPRKTARRALKRSHDDLVLYLFWICWKKRISRLHLDRDSVLKFFEIQTLFVSRLKKMQEDFSPLLKLRYAEIDNEYRYNDTHDIQLTHQNTELKLTSSIPAKVVKLPNRDKLNQIVKEIKECKTKEHKRFLEWFASYYMHAILQCSTVEEREALVPLYKQRS